MSIIQMTPELNQFCEAHDLYEYDLHHLVIMPNGFRFVTRDTALANRMLTEHGAETRHIVELGE
jgi:hypothetical protein